LVSNEKELERTGKIKMPQHCKCSGAGVKCNLSIDGEEVDEGEIPRTVPFAYSGDEGVDVGTDNETNVSDDYKEGDNKSTGKIHRVLVDNAPKVSGS
jgi:arylsulfatase